MIRKTIYAGLMVGLLAGAALAQEVGDRVRVHRVNRTPVVGELVQDRTNDIIVSMGSIAVTIKKTEILKIEKLEVYIGDTKILGRGFVLVQTLFHHGPLQEQKRVVALELFRILVRFSYL